MIVLFVLRVMSVISGVFYATLVGFDVIPPWTAIPAILTAAWAFSYMGMPD